MAPDTVGDRLHFSPEELLVKVEVLTAGKSLMHLRGEIFSASAPERLCVSATAVYAFVPAKLSFGAASWAAPSRKEKSQKRD